MPPAPAPARTSLDGGVEILKLAWLVDAEPKDLS